MLLPVRALPPRPASGSARTVVSCGCSANRLPPADGYAALSILASALESKSGILVQPAEGFLVKGEQGPLVPGELERAVEWGKQLV